MISRLLILILLLASITNSSAQKSAVKVGAYYFDGWSGTTFHITEDLKKNYPDREPKWGWVTSTQEIVDEQIGLAADVGLKFFSFCWYARPKENPDNNVNNRALGFYKSSKNRKKLEYCLLVANHAGYEIEPWDWSRLQEVWLKELKHPQYLKANGKPVLIFFEHGSLVRKFGSPEGVKLAFDSLRQYAIEHGLKKGINIAICEGGTDGIKIAEACGADLVTGYNYHSAGFEGTQQQIPIEKMQVAEQKLWDKLAAATRLKYIPVSTIGWDPRPWSNATNKYFEKPYFTGFSAASVKLSVHGIMEWVKKNPQINTPEKIALLYAWNENGEGSWLTPGKNGLDPSIGVRDAIKK